MLKAARLDALEATAALGGEQGQTEPSNSSRWWAPRKPHGRMIMCVTGSRFAEMRCGASSLEGETRGNPIESKTFLSSPANNGPKAHYG